MVWELKMELSSRKRYLNANKEVVRITRCYFDAHHKVHICCDADNNQYSKSSGRYDPLSFEASLSKYDLIAEVPESVMDKFIRDITLYYTRPHLKRDK